MAMDNEQVVLRAYQIAEVKDMAGWVAAFTDDGTFTGRVHRCHLPRPRRAPRAGRELRAGVPGHAPRAVPSLRQRRHRGGPAGSPGNAPRPVAPALRDAATARQAHARTHAAHAAAAGGRRLGAAGADAAPGPG